MKWTAVKSKSHRHVSQLPDDWQNLYFRSINRFFRSEFLMPLQKAFLAQTGLETEGTDY